jgi:hypothetical protein
MATNHHVCPSYNECSGSTAIQFPLLNFTTRVTEFYGSWDEIDLSLFAIEVNDPKVIALLTTVASPFAFHDDLKHGEPLVTIGFGIGDNPGRVMMGNRDSDCKVYSRDGEYRLMADPDDLNPGPYKAWSFANGCDVSHGDSGSAMMDRDNGHVVGIIWTGKIPKNPKVQQDSYLKQIFNSEPASEDVWKELSYSVPAVEMNRYLTNAINKGQISEEFRATLTELLQHP